MAKESEPKMPLKIIGAGEFDSGIGDLSTNKKHMEGFGLTRLQRLKLAESKQEK